MADARVKDRAKQLAQGQGVDDAVVTLSTGVQVRLHAVSGSLVEDVKDAIPEPKVPVVYIEAKDREEENPSDPNYIKAMEEWQRKRGDAVLDALLTFGVELLDGVPEDGKWLKGLKLLERKKLLDLSGFDLEDEFDREYLFKRHVAVAGADLQYLAPLQSVRPEEVARARRTFLGHEARDSGRGLRAKELDTDGDRDESGAAGVGGGARSEP
jgi:hypothetical protein